jgi:hypothetical protein
MMRPNPAFEPDGTQFIMPRGGKPSVTFNVRASPPPKKKH